MLNKELKKHINENIKAQYKTFDKGHNVAHFNFVTKNCVSYGKQLNENGANVDLDIAYIVGAYHDIGIMCGRDNHAKSSGKIVREDALLKKYYSSDIIEIIAEAVEDHSSHLSYEPRNIYGKIVADADRNNTMYLVFSRPIKYALKNEPKTMTKAEHLEKIYDFVNSKFGRNGYVKYWLDIPDTTKEQQKIWTLLDNKQECLQYISGLFDEITKGKIK